MDGEDDCRRRQTTSKGLRFPFPMGSHGSSCWRLPESVRLSRPSGPVRLAAASYTAFVPAFSGPPFAPPSAGFVQRRAKAVGHPQPDRLKVPCSRRFYIAQPGCVIHARARKCATANMPVDQASDAAQSRLGSSRDESGLDSGI